MKSKIQDVTFTLTVAAVMAIVLPHLTDSSFSLPAFLFGITILHLYEFRTVRDAAAVVAGGLLLLLAYSFPASTSPDWPLLLPLLGCSSMLVLAYRWGCIADSANQVIYIAKIGGLLFLSVLVAAPLYLTARLFPNTFDPSLCRIEGLAGRGVQASCSDATGGCDSCLREYM